MKHWHSSNRLNKEDSLRVPVTTDRGITLGDTLEDIQLAYPEVTRSLDGTTGTDGRYEAMLKDHPSTYLFFYVEKGKVVKLQLPHEFE